MNLTSAASILILAFNSVVSLFLHARCIPSDHPASSPNTPLLIHESSSTHNHLAALNTSLQVRLTLIFNEIARYTTLVVGRVYNRTSINFCSAHFALAMRHHLYLRADIMSLQLSYQTHITRNGLHYIPSAARCRLRKHCVG